MGSETNCFIFVVIPTFNRAKSLEKSIMSVLGQTYSKLECGVVDDCSTNSKEEIVRKIKDKRIRYIKNLKNMGVTKARNIGTKVVRIYQAIQKNNFCEIVLWVDSRWETYTSSGQKVECPVKLPIVEYDYSLGNC